MEDAPSVTLNKLYFSVHVSHARLMRTTPHEWERHLKGDWRPIPRCSSTHGHGKRSAGLGVLHWGFCMAQGSSPLTRGKLLSRRPLRPRKGPIPAHAGKTHNVTRVAHLPGDHSQVGWLPPSCAPHHYSKKDSSLLTQGIPVGYGDRVRIPGIIPANAGNTWPTGRTVSTRADHPCLRGEHTV